MALKCSIGGRDSDSFITVSEADSYLESLPEDTEAWSALTSTQKEYRLRLAAHVMGLLSFRGRQIFCGQALAFPRSSSGVRIPDEIKEAQAHLAYSLIHRALANRPDIEDGETSTERVSSVSIGGLLSVTFSGDAAKGGGTLDSIIRSAYFPIYLRIKHYLSQLRGGSVKNTDDEDYPECSTTTTTSSSSTTTSTSSTTTTTG